MPTSFSDALSPLSKRMPQAVKDIEILRVSAQLDGDNFIASAKTARQTMLAWANKRAGGALPKEAWDHRDFELVAGGRNSAAVRMVLSRFSAAPLTAYYALKENTYGTETNGRI